MFATPIPAADLLPTVSANKDLVRKHLTRADRSQLALDLTEDVEWVEWAEGVPPTGVVTKGRAAYVANSGDDELRTTVQRMIEEDNIVVVEGVARVTKKDGRTFNVQFVDIFEMISGKIKRKTSYGFLTKDGG